MAQALGLGTCTITSWSASAVQVLRGLPDHIRPDVTVAVGFVAASPSPAARGFRTSWHDNRFGSGFDVRGTGEHDA